MKWVILAAAAALATFFPSAGTAAPSIRADACGVPAQTPVWVDFGGHDAPIPAKPGVVIAVASGTDVPQQMRDAGAATVLFDLNLNKRVGTSTNPADPSLMEARAKSLYDYAVQVTGCQTPMIAENELAGAQTPTPWTTNNAQYRANVLQFLTAALGASAPRRCSRSRTRRTRAATRAYWWQQVSKVAILLRQVYFTSPNAAGLYELGPGAASRVDAAEPARPRQPPDADRDPVEPRRAPDAVHHLARPRPARRPAAAQAWFEIVKLEALAAKFVATAVQARRRLVVGLGDLQPERRRPTPTRPAAACVWLWARDQTLCDGPAAAGEGFDTSLTEGQLDVPAGAPLPHERRHDLPERGGEVHRADGRPGVRGERPPRAAHPRRPGEGRLTPTPFRAAGGDRARSSAATARSTGPP